MIYNPFSPDDNDEFKVKRNFALTAFFANFSIVIYVFYIIKTGDENTASNLSAGAGIITMALTALAIPIAQYFFMTGNKKTD